MPAKSGELMLSACRKLSGQSWNQWRDENKFAWNQTAGTGKTTALPCFTTNKDGSNKLLSECSNKGPLPPVTCCWSLPQKDILFSIPQLAHAVSGKNKLCKCLKWCWHLCGWKTECLFDYVGSVCSYGLAYQLLK